ncbi:MAG: hypothetical protein WA130_13075 [Candidatus Methanoperedens sp.]
MPLNSPGMRSSIEPGASNTTAIKPRRDTRTRSIYLLASARLRAHIGAGASQVRCYGISPPQDDRVL